MNHTRSFALGAVSVAGLLGGCTLTPSARTQARIQEKPAVFQALTPQQQGDILGGAIERNNTTEMVFLALGQPSRIVTSADGKRAMWVYQEYTAVGPAFTTSFNNPNSSHYTPGATGINSALDHGGPAWMNQPGFVQFGTTNASPVQSLAVPELKLRTIYVFFALGRVAEIKVEGNVADQRTAVANTSASRAKVPTKMGWSRSVYGDDEP
ncbi:MAG: hypothetical protein JWM35_877 [Verrucomicrobia bacterium]|nr:hypothetical protein [Verrucomicrobiota bacterium]